MRRAWSKVALAQRLIKPQRFRRKRVGQPGHPALGAQRQGFEGDIVEPGEQHEAIAERIDDVGEAARIGRGFLDRDNRRDIRQTLERRQVDIHPVGRRIVVQHDGQPARGRHGAESDTRVRPASARTPWPAAPSGRWRPGAPHRGRRCAAVAVVNSETPTITGALPRSPRPRPVSTLRFSSALRGVALAHRAHQHQAMNAIIAAALSAPVASPANRPAWTASNCVVAAGNTPDQEHGRV